MKESNMILSKKAIHNLHSILQGMNINKMVFTEQDDMIMIFFLDKKIKLTLNYDDTWRFDNA